LKPSIRLNAVHEADGMTVVVVLRAEHQRADAWLTTVRHPTCSPTEGATGGGLVDDVGFGHPLIGGSGRDGVDGRSGQRRCGWVAGTRRTRTNGC
jgi:hypothetical protein